MTDPSSATTKPVPTAGGAAGGANGTGRGGGCAPGGMPTGTSTGIALGFCTSVVVFFSPCVCGGEGGGGGGLPSPLALLNTTTASPYDRFPTHTTATG